MVPSVNRLLKTKVPTVKQITIVNMAQGKTVPSLITRVPIGTAPTRIWCPSVVRGFLMMRSKDEIQTSASAEILNGVSASLHLVALQGLSYAQPQRV